MTNVLLYYLIVINIVTFLVYGIDKWKAKQGSWRISEATLLILADMVVNRNEITPELAAEIEKARREFREGKTISLRTHEDIDRYFDSM